RRLGAGTLAVHAPHLRRALPRAAGDERSGRVAESRRHPGNSARAGDLHLHHAVALPPAARRRSGRRTHLRRLAQRQYRAERQSMTTQTEERTGFRRTLVRVLAMQIATLL